MDYASGEVRSVSKMEEAFARVEEQRGADAGVNEVCDFLSAWVRADEDAAPLILNKKKTAQGAFNALNAYARKNQKGGYYRYEEKLAFVKIMAYYGVPEKEADTQLERGLLYRVMTDKLDRWRPYGVAAPVSAASAPVSAGCAPVSTASAPVSVSPTMGLSLSLSDLGL